MKNQQNTLPYFFYYWQTAFFSLVGLLTSLYLTYTHYKNHTDLSFSSFCAVTQTVNCDTVAQSPWSILWGLPVAIWGVYAYALFLVLLIPLKQQHEKSTPGWSAMTILALLASCGSIYLALVSKNRIHSWCILCVTTYAVNFLIAFSSWITFRRFSTTHFFSALPVYFNALRASATIKLGVSFLIILLIATRLFIPTYWIQKLTTTNPNIATGVTEEGHPWIGAQRPKFVIEEFTDYQCFQCSKTHFYLRQLINQHPDNIRLVHRHYPLDDEFNRIIAPDSFHVGSGRLALVAIVAANHGFFWTINDALYQAMQSKNESIDIGIFAKLMKIPTEQLATEMFAVKTLKYLQHDIVQGLQHGITGTPSFIINGKVHQKILPPELVSEMLK